MPMEIHDDKIVMRAGKYNLPPKCCCGEPWRLNTVHREKTPCFSYIEHEWVGLTLDERLELAQDVDWAAGAYCEYAEKIEAKLKEKNA